MANYRNLVVIGLSGLATAAVAAGIVFAFHSPLFMLQVVEIADLPDNAPISAHELTQLAAIPVGTASLFKLDLNSMERKILSNPWVREVRLEKRLPQTLSISVGFREPRALLQSDLGALSYVDKEGKSFGKVNLSYQADLPLLTGFDRFSDDRLKQAVHFLDQWAEAGTPKFSEVSSLGWDAERGFRAVITYHLLSPARLGRTTVDLGQNIDDQNPHQLERLSRVLHYLSDHGIAARQIWADAGKKIVVKTAHGS